MKNLLLQPTKYIYIIIHKYFKMLNARFSPRGKARRVSLLEQGGGRLRAGYSDHRDHRNRLSPYIDHMDDSASSSTSEYSPEFFPDYHRPCAL
jgi:hypothetical protein